MKTRITSFASLLALTSAAVLTTLFFIVAAQSGRTGQPTKSEPGQPSQGTAPSRSDKKSTSVSEREGDEYDIVFSTSHDGDIRWKHVDYEQATHSDEASFVKEINRAAAQGFRFLYSLGGYSLTVVKRDETEYEYVGVETTSDMSLVTAGLDEKYLPLSRQGYHIVSNTTNGLENCSTNSITKENVCKYRHFFLLEREKGVQKPREQSLIYSIPGWKMKMGVELTDQVREGMSQGFYPTIVFSRSEMLLERAETSGQPGDDKPEVKVVTSGWHDDVKKKINDLAKEGYRLALISNGVAVMYRRGDAATQVSYVWVDTNKKDFENKLAEMQGQGAIYRMCYPDPQGMLNALIFELRAGEAGHRREYKTIKLDLQQEEDRTENKVHIELTSASKANLRTINELAKEGFVVRGLFDFGKVGVLLERSVNGAD